MGTSYRLDSPHNSGGERDSPHLSRPVLGPIHPPIQCVPGLFSRGSIAEVWRWPPTPIWQPYSLIWAFMVCSRMNLNCWTQIFRDVMLYQLTNSYQCFDTAVSNILVTIYQMTRHYHPRSLNSSSTILRELCILESRDIHKSGFLRTF